MSKELTPLKAFKNLREQNDFLKQRNIPKENRFDDELKIIETALKKLENYEQNEDFNKDVLNYAFINDQDKIEKLKALEIIKKKEVNIHNFKKFIIQQDWTFEQYLDELNDPNTNRHQFSYYRLIREEFDLVKKVLA